MRYNLTSPVNTFFDNVFGTNKDHFMDFGWPLSNQVFESAVPALDKKYTNWAKFNVKEIEQGFVIEGELAGVKKEDLKIEVSGGTLRISGSRGHRDAKELENSKIKTLEYAEFSKSFSLSDDIDVDDVDAHFENGFLSLTLKRTAKKTKSITLK